MYSKSCLPSPTLWMAFLKHVQHHMNQSWTLIYHNKLWATVRFNDYSYPLQCSVSSQQQYGQFVSNVSQKKCSVTIMATKQRGVKGVWRVMGEVAQDWSPFIRGHKWFLQICFREMATSYRGTACFYAYHSILHPDKWGSWQENNEGWFERQKERVAKKEKLRAMKGRQKLWKS